MVDVKRSSEWGVRNEKRKEVMFKRVSTMPVDNFVVHFPVFHFSFRIHFPRNA